MSLATTVQNYAWGSHDLLAELRGDPPSDKPEAELWLGAHHSGPSHVVVADEVVALDDAIRRWPHLIGDDVSARFGGLPYLLKLLAAAQPLSLQAHPDKRQAEAGFRRENEAGIDLGHPSRSYRDDNHKPELICALTPFRALSGLRTPSDVVEVLSSFECLDLGPYAALASEATGPSDLLAMIESILTMDAESGRELADSVADAARSGCGRDAERDLVLRISEARPGDPGVVIALMLELVILEPGQAIYLGAGRLHAYVDGLGVEIMAASDNVLRGGLTPKHVDVTELMATLRAEVDPIQILSGELIDGVETTYRTPAPDFLLSRIAVDGEVLRHASGPEILLVTSGSIDIDGEECRPTEARFVPAGADWSASGSGEIYRARVGDR